MTKKDWNLMYTLGNTGRIVGDADNPQARKSALEGAALPCRSIWSIASLA
ncbi:hypothetical protein RA280_27990 [Cupriavidus sp. CV2]|nr:hypothetical protein [Cupriavidus sp. CV2]MDW3685514.1 hypothetical protein [Cupriavidus sp. CV2]